MKELDEVRRATNAVAAAQAKFEASVRAASAAGLSLREIASVANVSYETIRRLLLGR